MRASTVLSALLLSAASLVSAQDQSISEGIKLAEKGIAWVNLPFGIDYVDGVRLKGYSGWITLPKTAPAHPCPAKNENDVNAKCE